LDLLDLEKEKEKEKEKGKQWGSRGEMHEFRPISEAGVDRTVTRSR
jgi:hypothetical protein